MDIPDSAIICPTLRALIILIEVNLEVDLEMDFIKSRFGSELGTALNFIKVNFEWSTTQIELKIKFCS